MTNFITLTCPSCGANLQITNDIERFACGSCGKEHVVKRSGGILSLSPIIEGMKRVQVGVDKTASELAIARLEKEIQQLNSKIALKRSRFDSSEFFRQSAGMGIVVWIIAVGVLDDFKAGTIVTIVVIILMNVGYAFAEANNEKNNVVPLQREVAQIKMELEKHNKIVRS